MPNIKINSLSPQEVQKISANYTKELAQKFNCPTDWITFCSETQVIFCEGNEVTDSTTITVEWFSRGQDVQDQVAKVLTEAIKETCSPKVYNLIQVVFIELKPHCFYENGEHY